MTTPNIPFAFVKAGELPPWDSPASILDVEVQDETGQPVDLVTVVYRYAGDWFVVTGHSGAKACSHCGQPITPLEPLILDLGDWPWPTLPPAEYWAATNPDPFRSPGYPRLIHNECFRFIQGLKS